MEDSQKLNVFGGNLKEELGKLSGQYRIACDLPDKVYVYDCGLDDEVRGIKIILKEEVLESADKIASLCYAAFEHAKTEV